MSTPVLHYFDLGTLGRGEVVRVFLHELNIPFENVLYSYEDWPKNKHTIGVSLTGKLPVFEFEGQKLSQHLSILRYLARRAGAYDGETNYEKWLVDAVTDIYDEWRTAWVAQLTAKDENYKTKTVPHFYDLFTHYYSLDTSGPYLLGNKPTYADFAVFQAIDNDTALGNAPATLSEPLKKLQEAVLSRPNLKAYLAGRTKA